jgi:hypothetical protein
MTKWLIDIAPLTKNWKKFHKMPFFSAAAEERLAHARHKKT